MSEKLGENIAREWAKEAQAQALWDALQLRKSNPAAGSECLRRLAEDGSSLAMVYLGAAYRAGKYGISSDPQLAEYWLRRSAADGSIEGAYGLAYHLIHTGRLKEAIDQYSDLGERGYSPAFYALGAHFYKGAYVQRDSAIALDHFRRGEALGHLYAAVWACRVLMSEEVGWRERLHATAKWVGLQIPVLQLTWTFPDSDRLRVK
jgi:TPR repeat protein